MALKVIGAGFGRTGTLSLKAALTTLGFKKTHHMEDVMTNARQAELWHDVAFAKEQPLDMERDEERYEQWDEIYDGYQAAVDFPSSAYYKELLAHYPDAKVVLTVRDFDGWYASASGTIYAVGKTIPGWLKTLVPSVGRVTAMVERAIWQGVFAGKFEDKAHTSRVFAQHIEDVQAHVPADQLLVYQVKEGWAPLCEFLGCAVPAEGFPHLNDTAAFQKRLRVLRILRWAPLILVGLLGVAVAQIF